MICNECDTYKNKLRVSADENGKDLQAGREYFGKCLSSGTVTPEATKAVNEELEEAAAREAKNREYHARKEAFKTTTGYDFEKYDIVDYMNIVSGEVVLGTGFLSELGSQISDMLGTNSKLFEGKIAKAKDAALENLICKALHIGANALIGVDFDLMTLSNNMIVVSANGTAVVIERAKE